MENWIETFTSSILIMIFLGISISAFSTHQELISEVYATSILDPDPCDYSLMGDYEACRAYYGKDDPCDGGDSPVDLPSSCLEGENVLPNSEADLNMSPIGPLQTPLVSPNPISGIIQSNPGEVEQPGQPNTTIAQDPCPPGWLLGTSGKCEEEKTTIEDPCPPGWLLGTSGKCEEEKNLDTMRQSNVTSTRNESSVVEEPVAMITHSDPTYGISFQYPSNWKLEEPGNLFSDPVNIASLVPSDNKDEYVRIWIYAGQYGDLNTMLSSTMMTTGLTDTILNQSETSIGGHDAFSILYRPIASTSTSLDIKTSVQGIGYVISYAAPQGLFNTYLPVVKQIQNSFEFVPLDIVQ